MDDHIEGREHFKKIFAAEKHKNLAVVSLGDLGESKSVSPETTSELFSGTTACFELSGDYLSGFGFPYEVSNRKKYMIMQLIITFGTGRWWKS